MAHHRKSHYGKKVHHRSGGRRTSYGGLALAAGVGVAAVIGLGFAQTKVEMLRTNWYAAPLVMVGGAALLANRMPTIAAGLAVCAGVFGYMGFQANAAAVAAQSGAKSGLPAPASTSGYGEAGAYRPQARLDSGMFERGAGAMQGNAARTLLAHQAGTLMGSGAAKAHAQRYGSAGTLSGG